MTDWVGRPAREIAGAVQRGEVTAREVVEQHAAHIGRVDGHIGAFEITTLDQARAAADDLDGRNDLAMLPLAGVPVGIKDVIDVAGLPTRNGSIAGPARPAEKDDTLVVALREAGAIVMGKTRCPELCLAAASDNATGVARNPWNLDHVAGGSSGGSAAAIASGQVPIAVGSDGGGSIRLPSAACGIFGIKPTNGRILRDAERASDGWYGMSTLGPMGTTVADVALMLDVLVGGDEFANPTPPARPLRIAVSDRGLVPVPVAREVRRAWLDAARALRDAGHLMDKAHFKVPLWVPAAMANRSMQGTLDDATRLELADDRVGRRTRDALKRGRALRAKGEPDPAQAERFRSLADEFFSTCDVLLTPATGAPAFRQRDFHNRPLVASLPSNVRFGAFTGAWNLCGFPAAAVPAGFSRDGLPLSVQIVGGRGQEATVLAVARVLEQSRPWARIAAQWVPTHGTAS